MALRADERRDWTIVAILGAACLATHGTAAGLALLLVAPVAFTRSSGLPRLTIVITTLSIAAALAFRCRALIGELFEGGGSTGDAPIETRLAALSVLLVVAAAILRRSDGLGWTAALAGPAASAIAINLPLVDKGAVAGIAPRLQLMAFVALALCVPPALHRLVRRRSGAIVAMIVIAPIALVAMWQSTRIHYEPPPDLSRELQALEGRLPDDALLIAQEHSTAFQVKWFTRIETVSDEPPRRRSVAHLPPPRERDPAEDQDGARHLRENDAPRSSIADPNDRRSSLFAHHRPRTDLARVPREPA